MCFCAACTTDPGSPIAPKSDEEQTLVVAVSTHSLSSDNPDIDISVAGNTGGLSRDDAEDSVVMLNKSSSLNSDALGMGNPTIYYLFHSITLCLIEVLMWCYS